MFNKELYKKICDATCSRHELDEFCVHLEDNEYDTQNSFEKYFNISSVEKIFELFKNGKIDIYFLSDWANAFNWIVMAEDYFSLTDEPPKNIGDIAKWEISNLLDVISSSEYRDGREEMLFDYLSAIKFYSKIYKDAEKLDVYMNYCEDEIEVLCVDDLNKKYYELEMFAEKDAKPFAFGKKISANQYDKLLQKLEDMSYCYVVAVER